MSRITYRRPSSTRVVSGVLVGLCVALVCLVWPAAGPVAAAPGDISGVLFPDCRVVGGALVNSGWLILFDNMSSSDQTVTIDGSDANIPADAFGYAVPVTSGSPSVVHAGEPVMIDEGPAGCDVGSILIFGYYECGAIDPPGFAVVVNSSLGELTGTITGGGAPDQTVTVAAGDEITVAGFSSPPQFVVAGSTIDASLFDVEPQTCVDHQATTTTTPATTTTTAPATTTTSTTTSTTAPDKAEPASPVSGRPRFTG